jgi:CBS domain-containing protein
MRVSEFMSRNVERIGVGASARAAREQMFRRRIHHLLVERGGKPCGTLCDRDVAATDSTGPARDATVERLFTPLDATVDSDATMRDVANLMRARDVECLPVFEDGRVVGIVTIRDVLEFVGRGGATSPGRTRGASLSKRGPRGQQRSVR